MSLGGGGGGGPTETTNITSNLPEYVQPYFERLLQRSEGESIQGYQPYGGQRLAYFSPDELQSQAMTRGFANAGTPSQYGTAETRFTNQGAYGQPLTPAQTAAGQTAYTPYTAPQNAAGLSVGPSGYSASADQTGALTAPGGYSFSPTTDGYTRGYAAPSASAPITSGYDPTALDTRLAGRTTYDPTANLRSSAYTAGTTAQTYNPLGYEQNISRFMSPYQQNVTDIEKREAARQSEIMGKGIGDQATAQGGLGGYREAIQQSERERNLSQQMGDIQTRGSQAAYQNAQAQLERERAGGMGAARFGLDAFTQQQAAQQQQEQLAQRAFETSEQSRQQQETFAQSAFNAGESARQQAAQLGLSAQQQQEAAEQAQEKFSQSGYQMQQAAKQAAGSQQIAAYQAQQQALQAQGAQGIQAYQAQEAARQAQEKFQQSAYDMSNRYNLAAAQGLQGIGSAQQQDALSRIQALQGIGSQDRALRQASMDMGYDDFQRQRDFAKNQLSDFSGMLRGVPVSANQTTSTYSQQPGLFQQAAGAGLAGLGLYRGARG
jgi:hypothetical protein